MTEDTTPSWEGYKIVPGPEPGDAQKGKVTKVETLTWREFLTSRGREASIQKFEAKGTADDTQCVITIECEDGTVREECLNIPQGTAIKSGSFLGLYAKMYKNLPTVRDQVKLIANADGFWSLYIGK